MSMKETLISKRPRPVNVNLLFSFFQSCLSLNSLLGLSSFSCLSFCFSFVSVLIMYFVYDDDNNNNKKCGRRVRPTQYAPARL